MEDLVKDVFTAPVGTIFVLAGVLFLFIAVIGKISGKIEPGLKARVLAGVLGSAFISIGLAMNWPSLQQPGTFFTQPPIKETSTTNDGKPPLPPLPPPPKQEPTGDNIPDWVPVYPAKVESLSINMRDGGGHYGGFFFITRENPGTVLSFYQTNLAMQRWVVTKNEGTLSAVNEGGSQSITVTSAEVPGLRTAFIPTEWKYVVSFSEYKHR